MHTQDLDRLIVVYAEVFEANVPVDMQEGLIRHAVIHLGGGFCLHPFEHAEGSSHAAGSRAMLDRGHLDHIAIDVDDVGVTRNENAPSSVEDSGRSGATACAPA